jgi:hypothetical protein
MATITNEDLGIVLPDFDVAYRAAVAAAAAHHLPPDLAHVAASYVIDDERVNRQQTHVSNRARMIIWFWGWERKISHPIHTAKVGNTTHLCIRSNGGSIIIYYVGNDMAPVAVETTCGGVTPVVLDPRRHDVRMMTPVDGDTGSFVDDIMSLALSGADWVDEWGNAWIGEAG